MIEQIPIEWLFTQEVPLAAFLIAAFTRPATWSNRATQAVRNYFGGDDGGSA